MNNRQIRSNIYQYDAFDVLSSFSENLWLKQKIRSLHGLLSSFLTYIYSYWCIDNDAIIRDGTRDASKHSLLGSHCFTDSSKAILSLSLFKESSLRFSHRTHDYMQYAEKLHYPYSILVLSIFRWCQRCNQAKRNPKKKIFFWFINCGFVLSLFHFLA